MIYPKINLNGTAPEQLIDDLMAASNALFAAQEAVAKTAPHGRDYVLNTAPAYGMAVQQHKSRLSRISAVIAELQDIAYNIDNQMLAREGAKYL